jgi:DNA-binding HxlR family transcriptional regulator
MMPIAPPRTSTRRAASDDRELPVVSLVEKIEGRWTLQILLCLKGGALRFSDLRTAIPRISANVLTDRIRELETAGLVERRFLPPPAAKQLYALTPLATGLKPALDALAAWQTEEPNIRSVAIRKEQVTMKLRETVRQIWRGVEALDAGFEYEEQADLRLRVERLEQLVANLARHADEAHPSRDPDDGRVGSPDGRESAKGDALVDERLARP